jgi:hypothetical protein
VCDGTALGQHRSRFSLAAPLAVGAGGAGSTAGIPYAQYAFLAAGEATGKAAWHALLCRYAKQISPRGGARLPPLVAEEFDTLCSPGAFATAPVTAVANLAHHLGNPCPTEHVPVVRALAAKSAFESIAVGTSRAACLLPVLRRLASADAVQTAEWRTAARSSSVLAAACMTVGGADRAFEWRAVFGIAARLTEAYLDTVEGLAQVPPQVPVDLEDDWNQGHYFAPCLRFRRDTEFPAVAGTGSRATCRVVPNGCTKKVSCSAEFSPGVFIVTCGHGYIYGYSMMRDFESPKLPFELFSNRVADPASTTIVYDNGCHLLAYGLNRFAKFWSAARVLVDSLHYKGHCACSKCFDSSVYELKDFNSQACEQVNAFLKRAAPSFHQMTSRSCMIWMFCHSIAWNMRKQAAGAGRA